jgi:rhamnosyltransferase
MLLTDVATPARLGIFFFFDPDGVVDDYVVRLLRGFKPHFSDLVIVCNGKLTDGGRAKLSTFSKKIIVRENKGFDVWAYKTAMDAYGWDKLATFDEVILFNSTIMGPVYPFSEMFDAMNKKDLDFWGITKFHRVPGDPFGRSEWGYLPEHIQSHFHAYRKSLVSSEAFQNYWANIPPIKDYFDAVGLHEAPFTKRFADKGFKWDVYADSSDLEGYTYGPITFAARQLVEEKRCPIFKRRSFFDDYHNVLVQSVGNPALDLYEYLRDSTDFNTDLIWQNALRTMHLSDMVKNLHLDYVLPSTAQGMSVTDKKIALVIHLYYMDLLDKTMRYVRSMPEGSDVIVTVDSEENAAIVREKIKNLPYNCDVRVIKNRGRDVSALLVGVGKDVFKYDYVCFAHDKKVTQLKPYSIGQGFADKCFENILATKGYVQNILKQFEGNPRLGMLMPNPPNHADYFNTFAFGWGPNFMGTKEFLQKLGVHVPLSATKECIAPLGTMFWFRPQALKGLLDRKWQYEDFPPEPNKIDGTMLHYVERSYSYVAQSNGFYSAYIFSDKYARIELTNLAFSTRELTKTTADPWARATLHATCDNIYRGKSVRAAVKYSIRRHLMAHPSLFKLGQKTLKRYRSLRERLRRG